MRDGYLLGPLDAKAVGGALTAKFCRLRHREQIGWPWGQLQDRIAIIATNGTQEPLSPMISIGYNCSKLGGHPGKISQIKKGRNMNRTLVSKRNCTIALFCALFMGVTHPALAQKAKPKETKGVSVDATSTLTIAPQIPGFEGHVLRLRQVTMVPGGVIAHHTHANRPTVVYIVSGELTEYRDGGQEITHRAGEQWVEGADVSHWAENRGQVPAVLIGADIVPKK